MAGRLRPFWTYLLRSDDRASTWCTGSVEKTGTRSEGLSRKRTRAILGEPCGRSGSYGAKAEASLSYLDAELPQLSPSPLVIERPLTYFSFENRSRAERVLVARRLFQQGGER